MRIFHWLALILVIIGALNWGIIGLFQLNIVAWLFGPMGARIAYILVGLAGLWCFSFFYILASCDLKKVK